MKDKIDYILENFDFEKVQKVMTFLNWTWKTKNSCYVPKYYHLIDTAKGILKQAYKDCKKNKSDWACGTGGFMAHAEYDKEEINLWLEFILTEQSNY